jgi:hypothetical protein
MTETTPTAPEAQAGDRQAWSDLPLDQAVALRSASARLGEQFAGVFGVETIERFLHTSFDRFAERAAIPTFLPLMAERFARQRLRALAKVEGLHDDGNPPCRSCAPTTPAAPGAGGLPLPRCSVVVRSGRSSSSRR